MELEGLQSWDPSDRWVFLLGRVAEDSVAMDAGLRGVHSALRNRHDREALLSAPESWGATLRECQEMLAARDLDEVVRQAIESALTDAGDAWNSRNRYMHDLLVETIDIDDEPPTVEVSQRAADDRYRIRLARKKGAPAYESVTTADVVELIRDLVAARWRLRAARIFLATGSDVWRGMLTGSVQGEWDGTASWVGGHDEDDS
jgi:hypothetical protein